MHHGQPKQPGQQQDHGHKHDPLPGRCHHAGLCGHSNGLQQHAAQDNPDTQHRKNSQRYTAQLQAEEKRLPHPFVAACTIIRPANRLKALPETDQRRVGKGGNSPHHAHGGNGLIRHSSAIVTGSQIQKNRRQTAQPLPEHGRDSSLQNPFQITAL